jgi:Fe-S cluster assembly protein SufD
MNALVIERNIYATQFSEIVDQLPGRGLDWLDRLRKRAIERFVELGLPTTRLEDWKYTNVAAIGRLTFRPTLSPSKASVPDSLRSQLDLFPRPRLVFVDGMLDWNLSLCQDDDCGLQMSSLAESLGDSNQAAVLEAHLGRYADASNHAFVAWNTGFFAGGAHVVIPAGTTVLRPVHLVFVSTGGDQPLATHPRNLIVADEGSRVAVVETFLSVPGEVHLTNAVTEIVAGANATIDYYKMERESSDSFHVATVKASLGRDASLSSHTFSLGAALTRNDLNVTLDGEGSQCSLDGLFLVEGHRLVDNHTEIDHRQPHATSRELYKGILCGHAQGVFNGAIIVRKDAQKTDAVQHSKNLLLSEHAQINTKPQLEIRADDVRCAHGASIGQLDQEAMFYLKTRGVDDRTARQILIRGFASEILDRIHAPDIRRQLEAPLDEWFQERLEAA